MAERKLWSIVRGKQIDGCYFRRQAPIGPYIADFICVDRKLLIEVDGGQHYRPDRVASDDLRTQYLEDKGYRVLRFSNNDVLTNLEGVHTLITKALGESST